MKVIIDVSHSFHKSFFVFSKWDRSDLDTKIGQERLMRKAVTDLFASSNKLWIKPEEVYFCFDSHSWRKEASDDYKFHRSHKGQGFYNVINTMYDLMLQRGYKALKADQAEADDCISFLSTVLSGEKFIISADEDMHQLISEEVSVWNNNLKKPIVFLNSMNEKMYFNFEYQKTIVDPKLSLFKKIMLGCSGDGVSPLIDKRGIGAKTVEKLYPLVGDFELGKNIDAIEKLVSERFDYERPDFHEKYTENASLVNLDINTLPDCILKSMSEEFDKINEIHTQVGFDAESLLSGTKFFN